MGDIDPRIISIIPTCVTNREFLDRAVRSWYRAEPGPRDYLLLVADTFGDTDGRVRDAVHELVRDNERVISLECNAGRHDYGHSQCNAGIKMVKSGFPDAFIAWMDDDDVWAPHVFGTIHEDIKRLGERVYLYRFLTHYRMVVWWETRLAEGQISGHCIVAPARLVGMFGERYEGDFDMITATVAAAGGEGTIVWREECIGVARPQVG